MDPAPDWGVFASTTGDVAALREALADGTIDAVATDHAPHALEDKETEWGAARPGMLGLETALSVVVLAMVETGLLDWRGRAERMSAAPARIGGLPPPALAAGAPASLVLLDPAARWTVDPAASASAAFLRSAGCALRRAARRSASTRPTITSATEPGRRGFSRWHG